MEGQATIQTLPDDILLKVINPLLDNDSVVALSCVDHTFSKKKLLLYEMVDVTSNWSNRAIKIC